jgi:hypothetical protein
LPPPMVNDEPKLDWVGSRPDCRDFIHGCSLTLKVPIYPISAR